MSSIPQNKQELIAAIEKNYKNIRCDYDNVSESLAKKIGVEGNQKGSLITIQDTLAYLVGWGRLVLKWIDKKSKGRHVDFPEKGYKWNQLGLLAGKFHDEYRDWQYHELLDEYDTVINQIIMVIQKTNDSDLYAIAWYEKWTLGRMIQFNTSSPMKNMRTKVRRFLKAQSNH
ncbi:ClbS/DfsB family four-helix bundle protein [Vibrio jasicida]|uniref:ClbS/DfsB family four-helix bundle protein n=1 Tax=Vibrio jasicida TaxID=766224 RepID=UPI0005ED612A|nr:ClbS/DfsB family four-helix bundle protein [Vibrio jasicida]